MSTHFQYWRAGVIPADYKWQCIHNLWLSGAEWVDFCSYDPRFPLPLQLFRTRLARSEVDMRSYELLLRMFLREVDDEVAAMQALIDQQVAA